MKIRIISLLALLTSLATVATAVELSNTQRGISLIENLGSGYLAGGEVLMESLAEWTEGTSDVAAYLPELDRLRPLLLDSLRLELAVWNSNRAAWLLGYYRDDKSLPRLRELFLQADDYFYGWESSTDASPLDVQYKWLHVLEEAIVHITQKPIETSIKLTDQETAQLATANTSASLYVLNSLRSHVLFEAAARQLRWSLSPGFDTLTLVKAGALGSQHTLLPSDDQGGHLGLAVYEAITVGQTREEIERYLGPSLETTQDVTVFDLGCAKQCLKATVRYSGAKVSSKEDIWVGRVPSF